MVVDLPSVRRPHGRAHVRQSVRRLLELQIEVADANPRQGPLHTIDDAGLLPNEALALAVGAAWHPPPPRLGWQPFCIPPARRAANQRAFQELDVKPVGFGTSVLSRQLVKPSARRPSSRSDWTTQFRIDLAVGSNSLASSPGDRPARTSSTIWRLNSGA